MTHPEPDTTSTPLWDDSYWVPVDPMDALQCDSCQ